MAPSVSIVTKIKVQLKLSIARLRMVQKRDEALSKTQRRDMAKLLEAGKVESARIRVENIIRSDITTELHEILELYCELLLARAGLMEGAQCDAGLEEAVKSIIYAAPKTEIKELQQVRQLLVEKYGKDFALAASTNSDGKVSEKVVRKLRVTPPREELVAGYLEEIAKAYGVQWPKRREEDLLGDPPSFVDVEGAGGGDMPQKEADSDAVAAAVDRDGAEARAELSKATPPRTFGPGSPLHVNPPSPSTDNIHPKVTLNSMELKPSQKMIDAGLAAKKPPPAATPAKTGGGGGGGSIRDGIPDVDELAKRFAALKR